MSLLEIEKLAVLSTSHVSKDTADKMPETPQDLAGARMPWWPEFVRDEGWLFYLYGYGDEFEFKYELAPKDLRDVLLYVRNSGCMWCLFDCDGPHVDGLYVYDW